MKILFLDFETTGFPTGDALDNPNQPHIVSQALRLRQDDGILLDAYMPVQAPRESDQGALDVHGLSKAFLDENGIAALFAARFLYLAWTRADLVVSHNINFDSNIAQICFARHALLPSDDVGPAFFCTMLKARELMKQHKMSCNLGSAIQHFLDEEPKIGHHHALDDRDATERLFDYFSNIGETPWKPNEEAVLSRNHDGQ